MEIPWIESIMEHMFAWQHWIIEVQWHTALYCTVLSVHTEADLLVSPGHPDLLSVGPVLELMKRQLSSLEITTEAVESLKRTVVPWRTLMYGSSTNSKYNGFIHATDRHVVVPSLSPRSGYSIVTLSQPSLHLNRHFHHVTPQGTVQHTWFCSNKLKLAKW